MKKLFFALLTLSFIMISCNNDLQKDIDDLKQRVEDLEATDVASLEFQESNLIVTFGDGSTSTVTVPTEVIPERVIDFDIDNETGTITITFSDGTTKDYIVLNNGSTTYLSGTITGDFGIKSITMGDVELATMNYDDQNRLVEAFINIPDGNGNVVNIGEFHNDYTATNPMAIIIGRAPYSDMDYETEESLSYTYFYSATNDGNYVEADGDDMYTYYYNPSWNGSQYQYQMYEHCWFVPEDDINYQSYEKYYPVAGEDSLFYKSYNDYFNITIDDVDGRLYYPDYIIRITEVYEQGEVLDTAKTRLTLTDNNLIKKIEFLNMDTDEVETILEMTYDANDLITLADMYEVNYPSESKAELPEIVHFAQLQMTYTSGLLTAIDMASYEEDGTTVAEVFEVAEIVYDEVGNPVEIWAKPGYDNGEDYVYSVDPATGKITINPIPEEMQQVVGIEYDYTLPNFFGKTLEYLIPELKGLKIINAPVRLTHSGFFNFVNMEYSDYNEGGYPAKVKMEAYISYYFGGAPKASAPVFLGGFLSTPISTEMLLEYSLFE